MTRNKVIPLADQITLFIEKLRKIQEQARALGIFPNDRELLVCSRLQRRPSSDPPVDAFVIQGAAA